MELEQIFGRIETGDCNSEGVGYLGVHLYSGENVHVWFNNLSQLGDLQIGDSLTFNVLRLNNKALGNSYQLISYGTEQNTIAQQLQSRLQQR